MINLLLEEPAFHGNEKMRLNAFNLLITNNLEKSKTR